MASIFTKIINREITGHIIAENEGFIAILDINPLVMGHTLVIPKKEVDYIFDLEDEEMSKLHVFSKKVAHAVQACVKCKRIGTAVIGLEVPHVHVHLVPLRTMDDINFSRPKLNPSNEELKDMAAEIRSNLEL